MTTASCTSHSAILRLAGNAIDALGLFRALQRDDADIVRAGAGVLPAPWFDTENIERAARAALRNWRTAFTGATGWVARPPGGSAAALSFDSESDPRLKLLLRSI